MSTLIEVLDAMLDAVEDSSGPFCVWLRNYPGQKWSKTNLAEIRPYHELPYVSVRNKAYNECSLTDPNKKYTPIPTEWSTSWAMYRSVDVGGFLCEYEMEPIIDQESLTWTQQTEGYEDVSMRYISYGHDPSNWKNSLEKRVVEKPATPKTRQMTQKELALWLHGKPYAVREPGETSWTYPIVIFDWVNADDYEYADLTDENFPLWKKFPQVPDEE